MQARFIISFTVAEKNQHFKINSLFVRWLIKTCFFILWNCTALIHIVIKLLLDSRSVLTQPIGISQQRSTNRDFTTMLNQQGFHHNAQPIGISPQCSTNRDFTTTLNQQGFHHNTQPIGISPQCSTNRDFTTMLNQQGFHHNAQPIGIFTTALNQQRFSPQRKPVQSKTIL